MLKKSKSNNMNKAQRRCQVFETKLKVKLNSKSRNVGASALSHRVRQIQFNDTEWQGNSKRVIKNLF